MKRFMKNPLITWLVLLVLLTPFWWLANGGGREIDLPLALSGVNAYILMYALITREKGDALFLSLVYAVAGLVMLGFSCYLIIIG